MSFSVLARSSALRQSALRTRGLHTTTPVRSAHDHYHHLPFDFPGQKKAAFGAKLFAYLTVGFAIPFVATAAQLKKSGGSD